MELRSTVSQPIKYPHYMLATTWEGKLINTQNMCLFRFALLYFSVKGERYSGILVFFPAGHCMLGQSRGATRLPCLCVCVYVGASPLSVSYKALSFITLHLDFTTHSSVRCPQTVQLKPTLPLKKYPSVNPTPVKPKEIQRCCALYMFYLQHKLKTY